MYILHTIIFIFYPDYISKTVILLVTIGLHDCSSFYNLVVVFPVSFEKRFLVTGNQS